MADIKISVSEFKTLIAQLQMSEIDKLCHNLYMKINSKPPIETGALKSKQIEYIIWWAKGDAMRVTAAVTEARDILAKRNQLPVRGAVPNTHYMSWKQFSSLPNYFEVKEAVFYSSYDNTGKINDTGIHVMHNSPVTRDGYVSTQAIYNMNHWAAWKVNSSDSYERGKAHAIDDLMLGELSKLNQGRRSDQPALFPDRMLK